MKVNINSLIAVVLVVITAFCYQNCGDSGLASGVKNYGEHEGESTEIIPVKNYQKASAGSLACPPQSVYVPCLFDGVKKDYKINLGFTAKAGSFHEFADKPSGGPISAKYNIDDIFYRTMCDGATGKHRILSRQEQIGVLAEPKETRCVLTLKPNAASIAELKSCMHDSNCACGDTNYCGEVGASVTVLAWNDGCNKDGYKLTCRNGVWSDPVLSAGTAVDVTKNNPRIDLPVSNKTCTEEEYYRQRPDVKQARVPASVHYESHGRVEGMCRPPTSTAFSEGSVNNSGSRDWSNDLPAASTHDRGTCTTAEYYRRRPDVKRAGVLAITHYLKHGRAEGMCRPPHIRARVPVAPEGSNRRHPAARNLRGCTQAEYYQKRPDVKRAGVSAARHYALHGKKEGMCNPNFNRMNR